MVRQDFRSLLDSASRHGGAGVVFYPPGNLTKGEYMSYDELRRTALRNAAALQRLPDFEAKAPILVHFNNHRDNVIWFWSVAYSGAIPAMSTPFVMNDAGRKAHIEHLRRLLDDPLVLTREELVDRDFMVAPILRIQTVEALDVQTAPELSFPRMFSIRDDDLALLMLTSGSTGNAKAVCLNHSTLLAAIRGKSGALNIANDVTFINFIGFDHVASLTEIHLHALFEGVTQIHVQPGDLIADPVQFLLLSQKHRCAKIVAPNFFLARLNAGIEKAGSRLADGKLSLPFLTHIISGGEANPVETVQICSTLLAKYGVPKNAIMPAFGMTETCAGCTYNMDSPAHDAQRGYEFASLGKCAPGLEMRITPEKDVDGDAFTFSTDSTHVKGSFELKGPQIFTRYYNNEEATKETFTADGWFKTGDQAFIDDKGHLALTGRTKEFMSINGVKYLPHEVEHAIDETEIDGLTESFTLVFSYRKQGDATESVCVVYLPSYAPNDVESRVQTSDAVSRVVTLFTGTKPFVLPLDESCLQKSTLGKLSRGKIRKALESGAYKKWQEADIAAITAFRKSQYTAPATETERKIAEIICEIVELPEDALGVESPYFEKGVTSLDFIRIKTEIEKDFAFEKELPMAFMMGNSTVRDLSAAVDSLKAGGDGSDASRYNPIITLQPYGKKTPLYLIHPGVGEILVFMRLGTHLTDRPVHALRARGFTPGEPVFESLEEIIDTYTKAIMKKQPHGPYALTGYSWGGMMAFEVSKRLRAAGEEVVMTGVLNLPPEIAWRMRQLDWSACLANLANFSGLLPEQEVEPMELHLRTLEPDTNAAVAHVLSCAPQERITELGLTHQALHAWATVAFALQINSINYEPKGVVPGLDIFYCDPLAAIGMDAENYREKHLAQWANHAGERGINFRRVPGQHYTILEPENLRGFLKVFREALREREAA